MATHLGKSPLHASPQGSAQGGGSGRALGRAKRALVSVSDRSGLEALGKRLAEWGCAIYATGTTARTLQASGVAAQDVQALTGFPEILGGRVKTLHPAVFAGLLARPDQPDDASDLLQHGFASMDLVVCNLYPFAAAVAAQATMAELIEKIDIGGVSLLRAAAKNHEHVVVLCDPADYETTLAAWAKGEMTLELRRNLALKAFRLTAAYDALIADSLCARSGVTPLAQRPSASAGTDTPSVEPLSCGLDVCSGHRLLTLEKVTDLRYGENPHQRAALFRKVTGPATPEKGRSGAFDLTRITQLGGKELSYNNFLDCEHALRLAAELPPSACVIVKHNTPCGVGLAPHTQGSSALSLKAFEAALAADPISPFGGVVFFGSTVCGHTATRLADIFLEIVAAPAFTPEALSILSQKKNLRLLVLDPHGSRLESEVWTQVQGGFLIQDADTARMQGLLATGPLGRKELQGQSEPAPKPGAVSMSSFSAEDQLALGLALTVVKHVRSNAIVFANAERTLAIAGGFTNRVDAMRRCVELYRAHAESIRNQSSSQAVGQCELPFVVASDGFFPFADSMDALEGLPVRAIAQPGGSLRDDEVLARAAALGIPMTLTGERHFKH